MKKYLYMIASAIGFMLAVAACSNGGGSSNSTTACTANAAGCVYSSQYGWLTQGTCPAGYGQLPVGYAGTGYAQPGYTNGYYGQTGAYGNCVPVTSYGGNGYYGSAYGNGQCYAGQVLTQYGCLSQQGCPFGQGYYNGTCVASSVNPGYGGNNMYTTPYYNYPSYGYGYVGGGYYGGNCRYRSILGGFGYTYTCY